MKTKFLLPVLAMIFAIGMSFTSVNSNKAVATGFIETSPGNWEQVDVDCPTGLNQCEMFFSSDPDEIYSVYDAPAGNLIKTSNTEPVEVLD
jgi:hypothetical protein